MARAKQLISVVFPCYNEADSLADFIGGLQAITENDGLTVYDFEFIAVNDGSGDATLQNLQTLASAEPRLKVVSFTRNFGKEMATTAGIAEAMGDAIITIDADGEHPLKLLPQFVSSWRDGAEVVVGVRRGSYNSRSKDLSSRWFYQLFNSQSEQPLTPGSTDFRLISRAVQAQFLALPEHSRITRGLIDWLGYRAVYIEFDIGIRSAGQPSYSFGKLIELALNSFVSLSLKPLYIMAYTGVIVLFASSVLAAFCVLEMALGDPLGLNITGTAYLVLLVLFILGIMLISQGITALYISHIHTETKGRPLYVIDRKASRRLKKG